MDIQSLIKTDLNLLVTLLVLSEERSVSRAADRLYVTQSAVSKALARLRDRFDDPLFTRAGHGLVPTPYLEELTPQLVSVLDGISRLFAPRRFDPLTCRSEIRVAFPDMIDLAVTPRLLARLRTEAPGVKINAEHYSEDVLDQLLGGAVDFAISLEYAHYPEEFRVEDFLTSAPVVLARRGHPLEGGEPEFRDLARYPRITVKLPDQSLTDFYKSFQTRRQQDQVWPSIFETENMLAALSTVGLTDYLLPLPRFVADSLLPASQWVKIAMPDVRGNLFRYVIVSHGRTAASPLHQWFGGVLRSIGKGLKEGASGSR